MSEKGGIKKVCGSCGSEDVWADANATWDVKTQQWTLLNVWDNNSWCEECDGETSIEEVET